MWQLCLPVQSAPISAGDNPARSIESGKVYFLVRSNPFLLALHRFAALVAEREWSFIVNAFVNHDGYKLQFLSEFIQHSRSRGSQTLYESSRRHW